MNGHEDRIREALRTVGREVQVSEVDTAHAQHRFTHHRAQQVSRRHRRSTSALAAAAAVLAIALGSTVVLQNLDGPAATPTGPARGVAPVEQTPAADLGSAPSIEDLAGLWVMTDGSGWLWELHADGTGGWQDTGAGANGSEYEAAEFVIDGGLLTATRRCAWHVTLGSDGTLTGAVAKPTQNYRDCSEPPGRAWEAIRISPSAEPDAASHFEDLAAADPQPLSAGDLTGVWWKEDGQVLVLEEANPPRDLRLSYRLDNDGDLLTAPDDSGSVIVHHDTQHDLTLRPDTTEENRERGCPIDVWVILTDVSLTSGQRRTPPTDVRVMTADSTPGECPLHHDLGGVWIQVD